MADASAFDLVESVVTNSSGSIVARHRLRPQGTRATIFLHGAAGSWTTWTPVLVAAHEAGVIIHEPVLLDLPGWGDAVLADLTLDAVCELVRDVALELGYEDWDLVGHSLGGFVALHLATLWPETVRSIALISPTAWSVIESVRHPVRRFWLLPGFTMLWQGMRLLTLLGPAGTALVTFLYGAGLLRLAVSPLFRHPFRVDESVIAALSRELRPRSFVAAARIARGYDADALWSRVSCEVRAVKGDRDVFVRDSDFARLRRILPSAHTEILADCGHFAHVERADAVVAILPTQ